MIEILANGYSSESTQQELSNEYQQDRVKMFSKKVVFALWTKVASSLERLRDIAYFLCSECISLSLVPAVKMRRSQLRQ